MEGKRKGKGGKRDRGGVGRRKGIDQRFYFLFFAAEFLAPSLSEEEEDLCLKRSDDISFFSTTQPPTPRRWEKQPLISAAKKDKKTSVGVCGLNQSVDDISVFHFLQLSEWFLLLALFFSPLSFALPSSFFKSWRYKNITRR